MDIENLVVSRSNYVIQEKHQDTNSGVIFERDITTIGGKNYFNEHQSPVYNSGNFIITTSADTPSPKPLQDIVWDTAPDGSNKWNLDSIEDVIEEIDSSVNIELNPDVYDLRKFAYYGSCLELMRGSINHIANIFPGEVYGTNRRLVLPSNRREEDRLDENPFDTAEFYIDNPFGINLHEEGVMETLSYEDDGFLRFFNYGTVFESYEYFTDKNPESIKIQSVKYAPIKACKVAFEKMGELTITFEDNKVQPLLISVYKSDTDTAIYMTKHEAGWHIRPRAEYYNKFKSRLSLFEKVLMNEKTFPRYTSQFDVYRETEYGFEVQLQTFSFPVSDGGYNLGIMTPAYSAFIAKLTKVANFYDEYFSDNLYRSMTHEAIKNFDWSYKRKYAEGEEEQYLDGGGRIQKFIRLIGREFDEIKLYIDGITYANSISYNKENNIADYFLSDMVENAGWDYKHVIPFNQISIKDETKLVECQNSVIPYKRPANEKDFDCFALEPIRTYFSSLEWAPADINNLFARLLALNSPYIWRKKGTVDSIDSILSLFGLKNKEWHDARITKDEIWAQRYEKKAFPYPIEDCDCNDGVKIILDKYSTVKKGDYDYSIEEHVSIVEPIELCETNKFGVYIYDKHGKKVMLEDMNTLREINSYHKTIFYEEDMNSANIPTDWRGLMVKEQDGKLYPYFNKNADYDGSPYYQMNGGWLHKDCFFDEKGNLVQEGIFTETINKVKTVENLQALLALPYSLVNDNDIYYVNNLSTNFIVIGGRVYDLKKLPIEDAADGKQWYYFEVDVNNETCIIGDTLFRGSINYKTVLPVIKDYGATREYDAAKNTSATVLPINNYPDGSFVRVFVDSSGKLEICDTESPGITAKAIINEKTAVDKQVASHYFILKDKENFNYITLSSDIKKDYVPLGWVQLTEDSTEYKKVLQLQDYYKGNNPHTASLKNDFGYEYMDYFIHLMKYSVANDLFDWDAILETHYCVDQDTEDAMKELINNFGFKDLIDEHNPCQYKHQPIKKINKAINKDDLSESDKIINTKLVEITFYTKKNDIEKIKYIDSVVLPYLSQVLPTTLIIKIKYKEA